MVKIICERGYLMLQCAIALFCVGVGLSLILSLHVKSLRMQKRVHTEAWALMHAASARHIQHYYSQQSHRAWQAQLESTLPAPRTQIAWQPEGTIQLCWEGAECWQLE